MKTMISKTLMLALSCAITFTALAGPTPRRGTRARHASAQGEQTAVFAGGCFWGVAAVFEHVKGVTNVTVGYSGGAANTAHYEQVSTGQTGHAEAVKIVYDSTKVSYEQLLNVFFLVTHDPTELNRQGPDTGSQYRSAIFYTNEEQRRGAQAQVARLNQAKAFAQPVVTEVVPLNLFYQAEAYHQHYAAQHPDQPYIAVNDLPKVARLHERFPELYTGR